MWLAQFPSNHVKISTQDVNDCFKLRHKNSKCTEEKDKTISFMEIVIRIWRKLRKAFTMVQVSSSRLSNAQILWSLTYEFALTNSKTTSKYLSGTHYTAVNFHLVLCKYWTLILIQSAWSL